MTVGEFTRKLKATVNDAGYTSNNISIVDISRVGAFSHDKSTFNVTFEGNDGQVFSVFIEED